MKLQKNNIEAWKSELNKLMADYVPPDQKYSDCNSDEQWLQDYIGQEPSDVKDDDLYYSAQD